MTLASLGLSFPIYGVGPWVSVPAAVTFCVSTVWGGGLRHLRLSHQCPHAVVPKDAHHSHGHPARRSRCWSPPLHTQRDRPAGRCSEAPCGAWATWAQAAVMARPTSQMGHRGSEGPGRAVNWPGVGRWAALVPGLDPRAGRLCRGRSHSAIGHLPPAPGTGRAFQGLPRPRGAGCPRASLGRGGE